jgi:NAD(P)-dependent dehydrogenase (short-subunit alcohol dehydrogenase family)
LVSPSIKKVFTMEFDGRPALVTGANRGLGRHFAAQLRDRGAIVYAAARNPDQIDLPGVTPIQLDITDAASVRRAGEQIAQLAILITGVPHFSMTF